MFVCCPVHVTCQGTYVCATYERDACTHMGYVVLHTSLLLTSWNVVTAYEHFTVQMSDKCVCVFNGQHLVLMLFDGYIASCLCAPCYCWHPLP